MKIGVVGIAAAAVAFGLVTSGCSSTAEKSAESTRESTVEMAPATSDELRALLPTPDKTKNTTGPTGIADDGIHLRFVVDGAPVVTVDAYKAALQGKGWEVTTIASSGGGGGGGATYTATHGDAFSVIDGGGYENSTFISLCAWGSKPVEPNCNRDG